MSEPQVQEEFLYYLVTGEITLSEKNSKELFMTKVNSVISTTGSLSPESIRLATDSLTHSCNEDFPVEEFEYHNVVILNIIPIGYFTKEDWKERVNKYANNQ